MHERQPHIDVFLFLPSLSLLCLKINKLCKTTTKKNPKLLMSPLFPDPPAPVILPGANSHPSQTHTHPCEAPWAAGCCPTGLWAPGEQEQDTWTLFLTGSPVLGVHSRLLLDPHWTEECSHGQRRAGSEQGLQRPGPGLGGCTSAFRLGGLVTRFPS